MPPKLLVDVVGGIRYTIAGSLTFSRSGYLKNRQASWRGGAGAAQYRCDSAIRHFKGGIGDGFQSVTPALKQSFHSLGRHVSRQAE